MLNEKIKELAKKNLDYVVSLRRELHQHPELGFQEFKTATLIKRELEKLGIEYKSEVAHTGVVGLIKGNHPGKTVLLRADMDALPILEESNVDFKSKIDGCMHACGHDGHVAGLLGAAMILNELKDEIHGNIKLVFQPAEESPGGAEPMIEEGVLENPKVDAAFGCHIWPAYKGGKVIVKNGDFMAHPSEFIIKVSGRGGHGSLPELSIDPVVIGAEIIMGIQNVRSRFISTFDHAVISCTTIHAGNARNIIPDTLEIGGTVRSFSEDLSTEILDKIGQIATGIAKAYGAECEYIVERMYPPLINNEQTTNLLRETVKEMLGEDALEEMKNPLMGGEDFAYFAQKVPATFFLVGVRDDAEDVESLLHHPRLKWNDKRLVVNSIILAKAALNYLNKNK